MIDANPELTPMDRLWAQLHELEKAQKKLEEKIAELADSFYTHDEGAK